MAVSNKAKVSNLIYLTENGGTKLVRALFLKRMFDMKPHDEDPETWTLDMFLKINREQIEVLKLNRKSLQVLFPAEGKQTDISFWDLSLLISILKKTCELSVDMKMKITALKKLRDKLAHLGDSSITDSKYKDSLDKLHLIFEIVLKELKDEELDNTVKEMFQKLDDGEIPDTEISSALEALHRSCEDIKKSEEDTRNTVKTEHNETRKTIEKGNTELLNLLKQIVNSKDNGYTIPAKLKPLNGTTETDEHLTQVMLDLLNKEITNVPELHELLGHQKMMRDAVHMFYTSFREKGYEIVKAEKGCILIHVRFAQIKSLFSFYLDYISGDLDIYLDELEKASKSYLSFEEFRLEMILYEDDFCQVLRDVGYSEIRHYIADNKEVYVQDGGSTSISLTFKPLSHFDGKEFETILESEAKRLIATLKLPHLESISKSKLSEKKEITGQVGFHLLSGIKKESNLPTRESSTMTNFDESRITTGKELDFRAENELKKTISALHAERKKLRKINKDYENLSSENSNLKRQISQMEPEELKHKKNPYLRRPDIKSVILCATRGADAGVIIGDVIGGPVGMVIGGAVGALIGGVFGSIT